MDNIVEALKTYRTMADKSHELVTAILAEKDPIKKDKLYKELQEFSPKFLEAMRDAGKTLQEGNSDVV